LGGGGGGGGLLFFFCPPQASAEEMIRTNVIMENFNIFLLSMINLLEISYWAESLLGDFTIENGRKLEIP
jgi:hypothetical protein